MTDIRSLKNIKQQTNTKNQRHKQKTGRRGGGVLGLARDGARDGLGRRLPGGRGRRQGEDVARGRGRPLEEGLVRVREGGGGRGAGGFPREAERVEGRGGGGEGRCERGRRRGCRRGRRRGRCFASESCFLLPRGATLVVLFFSFSFSFSFSFYFEKQNPPRGLFLRIACSRQVSSNAWQCGPLQEGKIEKYNFFAFPMTGRDVSPSAKKS